MKIRSGHGRKPEELQDPYRATLPDDGEILFTHADLHPSNILVDENCPSKIVAVIDWEQSGWYPDYWEFCKAEFTAVYASDWHNHMKMYLEEPAAVDGYHDYTRAMGY